MKSSRFERTHIPFFARGLKLFRQSGIALGVSILAFSAQAQGPYYPVSPAGGINGATYGATYTGTPVLPSSPSTLRDLEMVEGKLAVGLTIRNPVPTGKTLATGAQVQTAVNLAAVDVINGVGLPGVTLTSLIRETVNYRQADRSLITQGAASAIMAASASDAIRITHLTSVVTSLAQSQQVSSLGSTLPAIYQAAGTLAGTAVAIGDLVAASISAIPNEDAVVASLVGSGLGALQVSALSPALKSSTFTGSFINTVIDAVPAANARLVEDVSLQIFSPTFVAMVGAGPAALQTVIDSAVQAIALIDRTNSNVNALGIAALRIQPGNTAAIKTQLGLSNAATLNSTDTLVDSYVASTSLANFTAYLVGGGVIENANRDAAVAGAIVRGVTGSLAVEEALKVVGSTSSPIEVVRAAVGANLAAAAATAGGAIQIAGDPVPFTPWAGTFADVAQGAVRAVRDVNAGSVVLTLVSKTTATYTAIPVTPLRQIINGAINGAYDSTKPGTVSSIVYNAMTFAKQTVGASGALVDEAITVQYAQDPAKSFVAALAALAGDGFGTRRTEIRNQATATTNALTGSDPNAILILNHGLDVVRDIQINPLTRSFVTTLNEFRLAFNEGNASVRDNSILAVLFGATQAAYSFSSSALATAIKFGTPAQYAELTTISIDSNYISSQPATLKLVAEVAIHAKQNLGDILDYVGQKVVGNPTLSKDIAEGWTVVDPNHAHWVSHAIGFNNPTGAATAVTAIFRVAQITSTAPNTQGNVNVTAIIDQPSAAAAITAGVVSGIMETNTSGSRTHAATQAALVSSVNAAVAASWKQNDVELKSSATIGLNTFRQSDGLGSFTLTRSIGAAGAVTGFMAQLTQLGDTSLNATQIAVITAAASATGTTSFGKEIAQAAAQAFAWVAGPGGVNVALLQTQIWNALSGTYAGTNQGMAKIQDAVAFGVSEAVANRLGAGALGLNSNASAAQIAAIRANLGIDITTLGLTAADFYVHRSGTGTPVTDIFNL